MVGGVGDREGGSGRGMSTCGGIKFGTSLEGKGAERLFNVARGRLGGRASDDVVVVAVLEGARFCREVCEGAEGRPFF